MIRLSRLSDYAIVVMCELAIHYNETISSTHLSKQTGISNATVTKILKQLTNHQLITSRQGPKGGYSLTKNLNDINVLDIISAIDGPVSATMCSHESTTPCELACSCVAKRGWEHINSALHSTLERFTLADFVSRQELTYFANQPTATTVK